MIIIKNLINKFLFIFGYRISKINNTGVLVKIHKYKDYEEYKKTQIFYNKQKTAESNYTFDAEWKHSLGYNWLVKRNNYTKYN